MRERKEVLLGRGLDLLDRRWPWLVLVAWLAYCAFLVWNRWNGILAFQLLDTDDNMRISQVRALLAGQDWFDLRQHRLTPPIGADIHWSRLVDLPLAGLIVALRPILGMVDAERTAVAVAPLLPLLLLLFSLAIVSRRLIDKRAYPLAFVALFFAGSTQAMFNPLRIDHHGWQLAFLSLALVGITDPKRARGGAILGLSVALSLAIGLELLIYLALLGVAAVLYWVDDAAQRRRLALFGITAAGGTALAFAVFASNANRQPVCDALSPVWLSDGLVGGVLLFLLAVWTPGTWVKRLAVAAGAGLIVAAFHALLWPHCLTRLEGVSQEVYDLWLGNVREARPIYRHPWRTGVAIAALPVTGALGWLLLIWRNRLDRDLLRRTLAVAVPAFAAGLLLLWQSRAGPAAQLLGITGAVALLWVLTPLLANVRNPLVRVVGPAAAVVIGLGAAVPFALDLIPQKPPTDRDRAISRANALCNHIGSWRPVAKQPRGLVFTFVDLGPRLITVTKHNGVIGPYHRNGEQIADVMKAFRGSADQARAIMAKYRSDYLLTCPNSSTTTIFMAAAPNGFYAQLQRNQVPAWLTPIAMPEGSPFRMWKIVG